MLRFSFTSKKFIQEARKRFDKASIVYDQAREKFLSLRKNTKTDVAAAVEEELHAARSSFEKARFSLVTVLSNVEAKKRYEFLEAVSSTMDAHLRFFKQSYELLHQMEPFIHQVLAYAQQSRECSNYEQASLNERMQEFRRQVDRISKLCLNCSVESPKGDSYMRPFSRNAQKDIEAVMQSAQNGKVQTIRQGYLSKRSSNLRGDWKRRFFVLDSRGMLYYYRKPAWPSAGGGQSAVVKSNTSESAPGLLSRLLSSHINVTVQDEKSAARHTLNLLTSTIKVDAEQSDLRFCFRIISPTKVYTLQAENAIDQMDWIEKITGVIASLLSFQTPEQFYSATSLGSADNCSDGGGSPVSLPDSCSTLLGEHACKNVIGQNHSDLSKILQQESGVKSEKPIEILRRVPGNEICADCGAPEPDWASLNLGILMCITCSGVHRNLGVHISKVRSLTLDVKAWEPSVISLFQSLGNAYANSVWEELLHPSSAFSVNDKAIKAMSSETPDKYKQLLAMKPCPNDSISVKELFIHAKYSEKAFVCKTKDDQHLLSMEQEVQQSVRAGDTKSVYRHIVCSGADVNAIHGQGPYDGNVDKPSSHMDSSQTDKDRFGKECAEGCSLLHLACLTAGFDMIELLLQNGADRNAFDYRGRTPLHYCILCGRSAAAKLLLTRGADPLAVDEEGNTALQLASATAMDDDEIAQLTEIIG